MMRKIIAQFFHIAAMAFGLMTPLGLLPALKASIRSLPWSLAKACAIWLRLAVFYWKQRVFSFLSGPIYAEFFLLLQSKFHQQDQYRHFDQWLDKRCKSRSGMYPEYRDGYGDTKFKLFPAAVKAE